MPTTEQHRLEVVQAPDGSIRCVYLNDYRIAGSKPYVSEGCKTIRTFKVAAKDLEQATTPFDGSDAQENLIVTAVTACFSINKDDPLAVAREIGEAFRLLRRVADRSECCELDDNVRALLHRLQGGRT